MTDAAGGEPLLEVRDLTVRFPTPDGVVQAVSEVSFALHRGESVDIPLTIYGSAGDQTRFRIKTKPEQGTLSEDQVEVLGLTLIRLSTAMGELCDQFGLTREELNIDLGPLGTLLLASTNHTFTTS